MKIGILADLHLGVKQNDPEFLESQIRFFRVLSEKLKSLSISELFILGDIFDDRHELNVSTYNVSYDLFNHIFADFHVSMIIGNHDTYNKNNIATHSLKMFSNLPNCTVYDQPKEIELSGKKVFILPWLTDYSLFDDLVYTKESKILFAHLDIVDMFMDKFHVATKGVNKETLFKHFDYVYTGHFHKRSELHENGKNIVYIGSPYQLTMIDENEDKGCGVLDLDNMSLDFIPNDVSMKFKTVIYPEELIDITNNYIKLQIPYAFDNEIAKISKYTAELSNLKPYKFVINFEDLPISDVDIDLSDISKFDLKDITTKYVNESEIQYKDETLDKFFALYSEFV